MQQSIFLLSYSAHMIQKKNKNQDNELMLSINNLPID